MKAEIISVGTELLLGQIVDTNANFLAQQLPPLGIDLYFVSQVGDNLGRLTESVQRGLERSDLVICSGGLGPTEDDLTREAIAGAVGEEMRVDPELESQLRELFARRGRTMPERNVKQATLIPSGQHLPNPIGTAPGWWVERNGCTIVAMPGVPHEMHKMWEEQVVPRLAKRLGTGAIVSRTLKLIGIGESHAEEALGDLTRSMNPTLATYAKNDGIHLRLSAKATNRADAQHLLDALEPQVRMRVSEWVYGQEGDYFPSVVGALLVERGLSLAVAESATGGALASLITDAPGASRYFRGGYVAYSREEEEKERLGVRTAVLDTHGTVAEATSRDMARAVRERTGADCGIGTTGVAGPDPSEGETVGTLHLAVDIRGSVTEHTMKYATTRYEFKRRGSLEALTLLWRTLRNSR